MDKRIAFLIPDMKSEENSFFVKFMNYLIAQDFEVIAMTETKSEKEDYRYSPKIKRMPLNAPIDKKYTRLQVLDYYVKNLDETLFVIVDKDYDDELKVISQKHKAVYLQREMFANPLINKTLADIQVERLAEDIFTLPVMECEKPGKVKEELSLLKRLKGRIRHLEEKRYMRYTYIQMSDEDVKKSQQAALSMLWEFKRICEKHNLRYYLAAGSLLGAARDGGLIEWDDDIDVTMPRDDYDKFFKIAKKELDKKFVIPKSNFPYGFQRMQIRDTNIERIVRQKKPHGIFMDILPLDGAPDTEKEKIAHSQENERLIEIMFDISYPQPVFNLQIANIKKWIKRFWRKIFYSKRRLMKQWYKNATKYNINNAKEWVCLPGSYGYAKECFPKEYWGEGTELEYEGVMCKVMSEWEKYLESHYGDYAELPNELLRRTHPLFSITF